MKKILEDRYYYLNNFEIVLSWVRDRYNDLLKQHELDFINTFLNLPAPSKAVLVRMVMRKGNVFRASKLNYNEIGDTQSAVQPLIGLGWVEANPLLAVEQLFAILTKHEAIQALGLSRNHAHLKKSALLESAQTEFTQVRCFTDWHTKSTDTVYELKVAQMVDRFRLMFFGNLHQDWVEFVLSDLGLFIYEKVDIYAGSRAFHQRNDVDDYLQLTTCKERLNNHEALDDIVQALTQINPSPSWLSYRKNKLLFHIAQHYEKNKELEKALTHYSSCQYPQARARVIRILEKRAQFDVAMEQVKLAQASPESALEVQQLQRILPRLQRMLGQPTSLPTAVQTIPRIDLILPAPTTDYSVEMMVHDYLRAEQPQSTVHYVENTLINSLFGLLCWEAIFTAIPGAFFHPFHVGPADLHHADFYLRRTAQFDACLSQLGTPQYKQTILENYQKKAGIQSPFVAWEMLSATLLEQALICLPANHLLKWFERILQDIKSNCAGYPDLIQFWPHEQRYRLIEVKGPGDRLQDNQIRHLEYCMIHAMSASVCYVQWNEQ